MYKNTLILVLLIQLFQGFEDRSFDQTQLWFDQQLVDHTDPTSRGNVWSQRYWAVQNFFDPQQGTVILYICGEYTCPGVNPDRLFVIDLAKRYKALVLVLEHRFYGNSMPFGDDSMKFVNLKFLNVHQALDDLAYFLGWIKKNNKFGVTERNPWISIGGSYPGAMSAWFRYKYPHLTVGALASSAVVNSLANYPQFDGQIYTSSQKSGNDCTQSIQKLTAQAEQNLANVTISLAFKQSFKSENLSDQEFLFMFADIIVEMIQYGKRTLLCQSLQGIELIKSIGKTIDQQMQFVSDQVKSEADIKAYGTYYLKNDVYDPANAGSRQWTYQTCSEVGWLQTAPKDVSKSMRSQQLTLDFFKQWCKDSFGMDVWPNTDITNTYFGGANINVPGLIMTNGDEDPWKHVSVLTNQPGQLFQAIQSVCDNCAHCVELYTPSATDSDELKQTRGKIIDSFDEWISRHWFIIQKQNLVEL